MQAGCKLLLLSLVTGVRTIPGQETFIRCVSTTWREVGEKSQLADGQLSVFKRKYSCHRLAWPVLAVTIDQGQFVLKFILKLIGNHAGQ